MALCKILNISIASATISTAATTMSDANVLATATNEVAHLFTGGPDMNALQAVAKAAEHRSLQEFKEAVSIIYNYVSIYYEFLNIMLYSILYIIDH